MLKKHLFKYQVILCWLWLYQMLEVLTDILVYYKKMYLYFDY